MAILVLPAMECPKIDCLKEEEMFKEGKLLDVYCWWIEIFFLENPNRTLLWRFFVEVNSVLSTFRIKFL